MHDAKLAQVGEGRYELLEEPARLFLFQLILRSDVAEELAIAAVLHDEEETIGCFNDFVELDDVWVSNDFQDVQLTGDSLHIVHVSDL